jgi:ATP-binding cassette subfamily C protein
VVAHRPSALAGVDTLLVMRAGRLESFGPKEAVFKQSLQPVSAPVRFTARVQGAAS